MILHAVMFTWKDGVTPRQVEALTSAAHALRGAIPGLVSIQGAPDLGLRPGNPDYLLVAAFEDEAAWHGYQAHPLHKALVAERVEPILSHRQSMQTFGQAAG